MGIYNSVYIGPYILVKNKVIEKKITENFHPDTGKKFSNDIKFCPNTGKELVKRQKIIQEVESFRWFDGEGLKEDAFFAPAYPELKNEVIHILNGSDDTLCEDGLFVHDMSNLEIETIFSQFREKYEDYFQYLDDNGWEYSRHFGVVHYAH